jgi:hypothetical protein
MLLLQLSWKTPTMVCYILFAEIAMPPTTPSDLCRFLGRRLRLRFPGERTLVLVDEYR